MVMKNTDKKSDAAILRQKAEEQLKKKLGLLTIAKD